VARLLVSVASAAEARLAIAAGADLVDAKDPTSGALGSLPIEVVRAIADEACGRIPSSAVAGEGDGALPAELGKQLAEAGVSFVKVGVDVARNDASALRQFTQAIGAAATPVAVLAAEDGRPAASIGRLAAGGFRGAMIDTRRKSGIGLRDYLADGELEDFVQGCRRMGLSCGLAGSLQIADIEPLAALEPDYLGFRGGLCADGIRTGPLDPERIREAKRLLSPRQETGAVAVASLR
jgi:(5-formylfuran-3-yl)methyl phosphate synthase